MKEINDDSSRKKNAMTEMNPYWKYFEALGSREHFGTKHGEEMKVHKHWHGL